MKEKKLFMFYNIISIYNLYISYKLYAMHIFIFIIPYLLRKLPMQLSILKRKEKKIYRKKTLND